MDSFTTGYIQAALWSSTDDEGDPLDAKYSMSDLAPATLAQMESDCRKFQHDNAALLEKAHDDGKMSTSRAGNRFWLTRNHHGAGFWDGELPDALGKKLTKASDAFGEFELYVGDDGKIYASGYEQTQPAPNGAHAPALKAQDFNTSEDALHHAAHNGFTHFTQVGRKIVVYGPTAEGRTLSARMYRHKGKYHFTEPVISKKPMPKRAKPIEHAHHEHAHHEHGAPAPDHKVVDSGTYRGVTFKVFQDFEVGDGTYSLVIDGNERNGHQGWHQDNFRTVDDAKSAVKTQIDTYPENYGADDRTVPDAHAPPGGDISLAQYSRALNAAQGAALDVRTRDVFRRGPAAGQYRINFLQQRPDGAFIFEARGDNLSPLTIEVSPNETRVTTTDSVGARSVPVRYAYGYQSEVESGRRGASAPPSEPETITYTTAPADYDWFGTKTIEVAGMASGKVVRKVSGPTSRVQAQRDRYASGLHMAVDQAEWDKLVSYNLVTVPHPDWERGGGGASAPVANKTEFRWDIPLDEKNAGRWVEAQLFGTWLSCWYQAPAEGGGYWVQFDPDSPFRRVPEIRELPAGSKTQASERLTYKQKEKLPDSAFALPKTRDLPLTDKNGKLDPHHVGNAAARLSMMWHEKTVSRAEFEEASRRIERARKKLKLPPSSLAEDCIGIHTHHDMGGDLVNRYAPDSKTPMPGVAGAGNRLTNADIEQWIGNDEGLYDWWRSSGQSKRDFIRDNRAALVEAIENVQSGKKTAHYIKYGGEADGGTLSQTEVSALPVGSIVYPANALGSDPLIVVPVPAGTLAPVSILPERADGSAPDGEPAAQWGNAFVLVSKGHGKLPTHGTAQRTAIAWNQSQRGVAGAPRRTAATYDFLRWMSGWSVTEEPGPDWLVAHRLSAVQGEQPGEPILFLRQDPRLWHAFYRDGRTGSGTTPRAALDGSFSDHVRNEKIEDYCYKVTSAPGGLAEQYPALASSQRSCGGGETSAHPGSERSWQVGEDARERGLVWLQRPDGVYWANATGGTFWLVPTPSGDYATTWMGTGGDQKDLGSHPYATAVQVAARFDPVSGQQKQAAEIGSVDEDPDPQWVHLQRSDDWGYGYLSYKALNKDGIASIDRAIITKDGQVVDVKWPDGSITKERITHKTFRSTISEMGNVSHPVEYEIPGIVDKRSRTWIPLDAKGLKVRSDAFRQKKGHASETTETGVAAPTKYLTKPGKHGTLHRYRIAYRDADDPGSPTMTWATWAYNQEDAEQRFHDDGEGWKVISVTRIKAAAEEAAHGRPFDAQAPDAEQRRLPQIEYAILVGPAHAKDTLRLRQFLARNGHPFQFFDTEQDEGDSIIRQFSLDIDALPALVWKGKKYYKPSNREVADILGFGTQVEGAQTYDVLIVGAGPSGLSCAVYAASEGLSCLVVEAYAPGGQAANSSRIENYAGFPRGISGADLAAQTYLQAQKFGARFIIPSSADRLIKHGIGDFEIRLSDHSAVHGKSVVLACGAEWRKPDYADLPKFEGAGVYYAATATEGSYVKGQDVVVVGGGNSAGQAAIFMSALAHKVFLIVRGKGLSDTMSDYLIKRIAKTSNIELLAHTEIVSLQGATHLERVTWKTGGVERTENVRHLFLMIGTLPKTGWLHPEGRNECAPSSGWLGNCVILDADKFIKTGTDLVGPEWQHTRRPLAFETSMPGAFAVGDVRSGSVKRVATAVGEGAVAITSVHKALLEAANVKAAE